MIKRDEMLGVLVGMNSVASFFGDAKMSGADISALVDKAFDGNDGGLAFDGPPRSPLRPPPLRNPARGPPRRASGLQRVQCPPSRRARARPRGYAPPTPRPRVLPSPSRLCAAADYCKVIQEYPAIVAWMGK